MLLRMLQRRVNRSHLSSSISQRWMGLFLHCSEYYGLVYVARGCLSSTYASMALEWPYVVVKPRPASGSTSESGFMNDWLLNMPFLMLHVCYPLGPLLLPK